MKGFAKPMSIKHVAKTLLVALIVLATGFVVSSFAARMWRRSQITGQAAATAAHVYSSDTESLVYHAWDQDTDSNYYRELGPAVMSDPPSEDGVHYGELDKFGRATGSIATVTYASMVAGTQRAREDMSSIKPTGWGHNQEVDIPMPDGSIYHGFLFNRSHLIAKSLGGADEIRNLITGTRTQNVGANVAGTEGGMAYCEGLVRAWLNQHQEDWVYYAATPVYKGDELLARSVLVDIRSSDGSLDQRIEVFNAARGFEIDYKTGTFRQVEDARTAAEAIRDSLGAAARKIKAESGEVMPDAQPTVSASTVEGERKVIVTRSGKAYHHDESCSGLTRARSMEWVSVREAEEMGRHPCGICGG